MNQPRPVSNREAARKTSACLEESDALDALEALSAAAPIKAAAGILRHVRDDGSLVQSERLLQLVIATAARLRQKQRFGLALQLTRAVDIPSPRLRLERALAALGSREDQALRTMLGDDPVLAAFFKPCLAVVEAKALPPMPKRTPKLLRDVHTICGATRAIGSDERVAVHDALDSIAKEHKRALKTRIWRSLEQLLASPSEAQVLKAAADLAERRMFKRHRALRNLLERELQQRLTATAGADAPRKSASACPSAGALANELLIRSRQLPRDSDAAAFRQWLWADDLRAVVTALDSDARAALDAATLCFLSLRFPAKTWIGYGVETLRQAAQDGRQADWISAAMLACSVGATDRMLLARTIAQAQLPTRIVEPMAHWVTADSEPSMARNFMLAVSCTLDVGAVARILAAIDRRGPAPSRLSLQTTLNECSRVLRPECDLNRHWPSHNASTPSAAPVATRRVTRRGPMAGKPEGSREPLPISVLRHVVAAIPGEALERFIE